MDDATQNKSQTSKESQAWEAHHVGLEYASQKNMPKAIEQLKKAIQLSPRIAAFHNNLANAYKANYQFKLALIHYFEALKLKSPYPEVHNNLGGLYYQQGNLKEAIHQFQKSIRMQPAQANTHYNLANCYVQNNRLLEAIPHFQKVLIEQPEHLGALHNLGIALTALKDFTQAHPLLTQVIQQQPDNLDACFHLGIIEASLGNLSLAQNQYFHVLELNPEHADTHHNLATLYLHEKNIPKAIEHYGMALSLNPNNSTARHMIDALNGITTEKGAPPEYVRALFDQYAYNYDSHIKEILDYQVPLLLRENISGFYKQVLDLGCGTGLCAPYFRDISEKLTGVDLSPNMIEVASKQGGYDKLIVCDINDYLTKQPTLDSFFDLIIAADVFVYFGDLSEIFEKAYQALNINGVFGFSIETNQNIESYHLQRSGRYSHNANRIEALVQTSGFIIKTKKQAILRKEENIPVMGMIFILKKPENLNKENLST